MRHDVAPCRGGELSQTSGILRVRLGPPRRLDLDLRRQLAGPILHVGALHLQSEQRKQSGGRTRHKTPHEGGRSPAHDPPQAKPKMIEAKTMNQPRTNAARTSAGISRHGPRL